MRKRNHTVTVRMNDEEYESFCTNVKKSGQTKQNYVVNAVLHVPVMSEKELEEVKKISRIMADDNKQMRGIAANINQMTRRLNRYREMPQSEELLAFAEQIQKVREESEHPWQLIRLLLSHQKAMRE